MYVFLGMCLLTPGFLQYTPLILISISNTHCLLNECHPFSYKYRSLGFLVSVLLNSRIGLYFQYNIWFFLPILKVYFSKLLYKSISQLTFLTPGKIYK
jgi:hypothetical protein